MKKFLKSVLRLLGQMAIVAAVLIGFQVVTDGMWLSDCPNWTRWNRSASPTHRLQTK